MGMHDLGLRIATRDAGRETQRDAARSDLSCMRIPARTFSLFSGAAASEILFEFHVSIIHYRVTMGEHCGHTIETPAIVYRALVCARVRRLVNFFPAFSVD